MQLIRNEHGFAITLAMIVLVVAVFMCTALWQYSVTENQQVMRKQSQTEAKLLAKSAVEATMSAWKASGNKLDGTFETVYQKADGTYALASGGSPPSDAIGQVTTTGGEVNGQYVITSTATVRGVSETFSAKSALSYDAEDEGLVEIGNYEELLLDPKLLNDNIFDAEASGITSVASTTFGDTVKYFPYCPGILTVKAFDGRAIRLGKTDYVPLLGTPVVDKDNDVNKVGIAAKSIYFDTPVDLGLSVYELPGTLLTPTTKRACLVVGGETIVFNKPLNMYRDHSTILTRKYAVGTLVIICPNGLGIPGTQIVNDVTLHGSNTFDSTKNYGQIFFADNVNSTGTNNGDLALTGKSYYFKQDTTGDGLADPIIFCRPTAPTSYSSDYGDMDNEIHRLIDDGTLIEMRGNRTPPPKTGSIDFYWQ